MRPRFHGGIRQVLRRIFQLYDTSGDASLSPDEWISAQKVVAMEISDDIDAGWIDEAAFRTADTNGDGVLSEAEFLEASFKMFEVTRMNMSQLLSTLEGVVKALEKRKGVEKTAMLAIMTQEKEKPDFEPPHAAWEAAKNAGGWKKAEEIELPTNLKSAAEVISLLRLILKIPEDQWLSIYFRGANPEGGPSPVTLLRDANTQATLDYLAKPNAVPELYVKNLRKIPKKLTKQRIAQLEERDELLPKRTGNCWGIDWETQLVGEGVKNPPHPFVIMLGDAVVIEVPTTDQHGEYTYVESVYMDGVEIVSRPVEEVIEPKVKKKKKKKGAAEPEEPAPDPLIQYSFIGLQEGKCVMFLDVSWEDQEGKLISSHGMEKPVTCNSIARIGPFEVEVQRPPPGSAKPADKTFQWWNGDKWSNKKGPAKKKKR